MDKTQVLKALSDETRMRVLTLLLERNYCVRALARRLEITESAVSQHLRVMKDAGLLYGEKKGYFMHYDVNREMLHELAEELEALAKTERKPCTQEYGECEDSEAAKCHNHKKGECSPEVKEICHGHDDEERHKGQCHKEGECAPEVKEMCHGKEGEECPVDHCHGTHGKSHGGGCHCHHHSEEI